MLLQSKKIKESTSPGHKPVGTKSVQVTFSLCISRLYNIFTLSLGRDKSTQTHKHTRKHTRKHTPLLSMYVPASEKTTHTTTPPPQTNKITTSRTHESHHESPVRRPLRTLVFFFWSGAALIALWRCCVWGMFALWFYLSCHVIKRYDCGYVCLMICVTSRCENSFSQSKPYCVTSCCENQPISKALLCDVTLWG